MAYRVEVIWNREFMWSSYGSRKENKETAIAYAKDVLNSGDGARVKEARVVDEENEKVVWSG